MLWFTWWCSTGPYCSFACWSSSCLQCQRCVAASLLTFCLYRGECDQVCRWAGAGMDSLLSGSIPCTSEIHYCEHIGRFSTIRPNRSRCLTVPFRCALFPFACVTPLITTRVLHLYIIYNLQLFKIKSLGTVENTLCVIMWFHQISWQFDFSHWTTNIFFGYEL